MDDLTLIIDAKNTPMPKLPEIPAGCNAMERIAYEVQRGEAEDELRDDLLEILEEAVEGGLYKHVEVNMRGVSGNALVIVGAVKQALHRAGAPKEHIQAFVGFALCDDYENVLATCNKWVSIVDEPVKTGDALAAFKNRS